MKKPIISFLSGAIVALLAVSCISTALAASGNVSYNFVNVSLNGETKITAGTDITATNGQKVPGTILFTDAAGGKTNYLPIRAVSELLGVEIGYDSATRTVLLGGQPAEEPTSMAETISGRQWQRELKDGGIHYYWSKSDEIFEYSDLPAWRPTELPEGFALNSVGTSPIGEKNATIVWSFRKAGERNELIFTCYRPTDRPCGSSFGAEIDTAALRRNAKVQGRSADFYQIDENFSNLFWEDDTGNLFWLRGPLDQAQLEKIAGSVKEVREEAIPAYQMRWMPDGFNKASSVMMPQMVSEQWNRDTHSEGQPSIRTQFLWNYSREPQTSPAGTPEAVTVKGVQARYWPCNPDAKGITASVGGKVVSISTSEAQMNTLLWTDPQSNITFRLLAPLEKDVMIRMAESISPK